MKKRFGRRFFFEGSLFTQWMISYLVVLLLPILICSFYFVYSYQSLRQTETTRQCHVLENAREQMDYIYNDVNMLSNNLLLNDNVTKLSYDTEKSPEAALSRYFLSQELNSYKSANSLIDDILLYFPQTDYLVTAYSAHSAALLDVMENQPFTSETLAVLPDVFTGKGQNFLYSFSSPDGRYLLLAKPLLTGEEKDCLSLAIIKIDKRKCTERLENYLVTEEKGLFALIDGQEVLFTTGEGLRGEVPVASLWDFFAQAPQKTYHGRDEGGEKYTVHFLSARYSNTALLFVIEGELYSAVLYRQILVLCATLFLCFVMGGLVTYYYTKKNYSPLDRIIQYISKDTEKKNEYQLIMKTLSQNRGEIERQRRLLKNEYLLKLLEGKVKFSQVSAQIRAQFALGFSGETSCAVKLLLPENDDTKDYRQEEAESAELLSFIVQNILGELLEKRFPEHYFCGQQNIIGVIVNFPEEDKGNAAAEIEEIMKRLLDFLSSHYHLRLMAGISAAQRNENISMAWLQAENAVEYTKLFGKAPVLRYEEIPQRRQDAPALRLVSQEYIQNLILSGKEEEVEQYFRTIRSELAAEAQSALDVKSCLYFFYLVTAQLRHYCQTHYGMDPDSLKFMDDSFFSMTFQEGLELIRTKYAEFMEVLREKKEQAKNDTWGTDICSYLENNYFDVNLNLNNVAYHFGVTPSYLSKRFKEKYKRGINEYIYEIRMKYAKKLLEDQDLKVVEVAEMTGFADSNAFIRIFKKYVGTTPGKFQEMREK